MSGTHDCPGCGRDDRVQAVPAVYLGGRDSVSGRERDSDGDMRTVTRTVTTGLSKALAPVPEPPGEAVGCFGYLAVLVAIGTFLGGALGGKWFQDEPADEPPELGGWHMSPQEVGAEAPPAYEFLGWISAFALIAAVLVFTLVYRRKARFARQTRGRHRAEELWSRGWYCHRCGTVHFADVPGEDRRPLTLQQFRERVWEHGGYGDLATAQRAMAALDD
ncbi:hypothetical protein [Streptomyces zaomyceticus]|uniref:hypothetical protein n=1 Tax=Streptomyces zaomyceticus TaxID=68286 RepID=UPI001671FEC0|nr:hypothetical protein [Streptomyces zaomyceticus]GHG24372.1 hypothetical protein GCM10018791_45130 [Streptomyces zaomyceticus]